MRLIRGLMAAALAACAMLATPTIAAASPGVGVMRPGITVQTLDQTVDVLAMISTAPNVARDRAGDRQTDRARRGASVAVNLTSSIDLGSTRRSPLEVGARRAGSVLASG